MPLKIYNTLKRIKEEFTPINPHKVGMYVCGMTVYDNSHLGHARAVITFDVIYRYLRFKKFDVNYVRNFTDVDDKIILKAQKENKPWKEIAESYIQSFNEDMNALGVLTPTHEPKATEHIGEMQKIIEGLVKKDFAYNVGADVFYSVRKKSDYGKLSGKKIDDLEAGARVDILETKKDPLDFSLWKASKEGEPYWESQWGKGRPGWHIECSAMSIKYLGESFDIHGGGRDLTFPHHENEIAQSEGFSGKPFANYWIHNGFININAEKMSKSKGNFLTIKELLKKFHPEVLRLFILAAHYRSPLDYTEQNIQATQNSLDRFYETKKRIVSECVKNNSASLEAESGLRKKIESLMPDFEKAMDDDFNTAQVMGLVFELVRDWNKLLDLNTSVSPDLCRLFLEKMDGIASVLGLFGSDSQTFLNFEKEKMLKTGSLSEEEIKIKIDERLLARKNKNWAESDQIRNDLLSKGVQLKDHPDGTTSWSFMR